MFPAIETERLVIRSPIPTDLDALVARRNEPKVARYQTWDLPYPRDEAEELLVGAIDQGGPTDGQWWMATVADRDRGEVVGDLAVNLTFESRVAEIGYTFASSHWGKGFASESVAALLQHLFVDLKVKRVSATLHPDNVASAQVVERAGMFYEGRTALSYWVGEGDGAVGSDDLLYGFTRQDWERWHARPTGPAEDVRLVDVTPENQRAVRQLVTHKSQERFVAPVATSFGDAMFPPWYRGGRTKPMMQAVEADGQLAGFVLLALATDHTPEPSLWRLMIDRAHQRRGIGSRVLDLVEDLFRSQGHRSMVLNWSEGRGSPAALYLARGYEPIGTGTDGQVEARLLLG